MSFAGKWVEQEIIIMKEIRNSKAKYHSFHSYVESRYKMMMTLMLIINIILIIGHKYKRWTCQKKGRRKGKGARRVGKNQNMLHMYIKLP
jgi:hypothetical protein